MKKLSNTVLYLGGVIGALLMRPVQAAAQITNPVVGGNLGQNDQAANSGSTFASYFVSLWNSMIAIGGIVVLIYFVWGAVEWISSGGEKGKIESARNRITQAIVGLIILVSSYVILGFVSKLFFGDQFDILRIEFPNALRGR